MRSGFLVAIDVSVHGCAEKLLGEFGKVKVADLNKGIPKDADVIVIRTRNKISRSCIEQLPKLKLIATATSGTDHIDTWHAKSKGIKIFEAAGTNADSVADYVFRMLLFATDDTAYTSKLLKETKEFEKIKAGNTRHELAGKSMGILGLGAIGKAVKKRAEGFGISAKAHDPYNGEAASSLDEVMQCDFVVLSAPLTNDTRRIVSRNKLSLMKDTAILVNVSRAELVDEEALADALKSSRIKAAVVDVFRNEPEPSPIYRLPNAFCTPHIAGNSEEAKEKAVRKLHAEIKEFVEKHL